MRFSVNIIIYYIFLISAQGTDKVTVIATYSSIIITWTKTLIIMKGTWNNSWLFIRIVFFSDIEQ